jgi:hypothetical protein
VLGKEAGSRAYEGQEPEIHNMAVAVATNLADAGHHMPCRWGQINNTAQDRESWVGKIEIDDFTCLITLQHCGFGYACRVM